MSGERGEYRAIRRVLLDGPDFQKLPERARWVFVALKLNFGPAGIEVHYPAALTAMLSAQTGAQPLEIEAALYILERDGWIKRDGNVVLIDKHLENDPHVRVADEKHRKSIQRHVAGLPRLPLVRAFIRSRKGWFPPEEGSSMGLEWAFKGASKGLATTEDNNKTEDKTECDAPSAPTFDDAWKLYPKRNGGNSRQDALKAWNARIASGEDPAAMVAGTLNYRRWCEATNKINTEFVKLAATFYGPSKHYLDSYELPDAPLDPLAAAAIAARDKGYEDEKWLDEQLAKR